MQDSNARPTSRIGMLFLLVLVLLGSSRAAQAQARSTASKGADISVFGGFVRSDSDYGPKKNNGITLGVDYTRYFGWRINPTFEVRANSDSGGTIRQKNILAGIRIGTQFNRFHPYADILGGGTRITYETPVYINYTDNAFTTSFGGGVDIDVMRGFQAKVDFQSEHSNYGNNGGPKDFVLTPTRLMIGVAYRLPFNKAPR